MAKQIKFSWRDIENHCQTLAKRLQPETKKIDLIIAITKGGLIPSVILAHYFTKSPHIITLQLEETKNKKANYKPNSVQIISPLNKYPINNKNILIVDDVADTGSTLKKTIFLVQKLNPKSIQTAVLHFKPRSSIKPNYFAKKIENHLWIIYPWER